MIEFADRLSYKWREKVCGQNKTASCVIKGIKNPKWDLYLQYYADGTIQTAFNNFSDPQVQSFGLDFFIGFFTTMKRMSESD